MQQQQNWNCKKKWVFEYFFKTTGFFHPFCQVK